MEQHRLEFKASNGYPSSCHVTIYRGDIQVVVVSETGEGMSRYAGAVTNAAEIIATQIVKQFGLDPKRMLFIEHYPELQRPQPYGESYDLVLFNWGKYGASSPTWRHMPTQEFHEILSVMNR